METAAGPARRLGRIIERTPPRFCAATAEFGLRSPNANPYTPRQVATRQTIDADPRPETAAARRQAQQQQAEREPPRPPFY